MHGYVTMNIVKSKLAKREKYGHHCVAPAVTDIIGSGKDNRVGALQSQLGTAEHVLKWNPESRWGGKTEVSDGAVAGAQYLKNKYDILKLFLGDFIPDSHFFVGTKKDFHKEDQTKIYTIQDRVPNIRLGELSEEQMHNPVLTCNIQDLLTRLSNMYLAMGIAAARTGATSSGLSFLDGKLDIGGLSYISEQYVEKDNLEGVREILETPKILASPNICVDPVSLSVYLVDFDAGSWNDDMATSKNMIQAIAQSHPNIRTVIESPTNHQTPSRLLYNKLMGDKAIVISAV